MDLNTALNAENLTILSEDINAEGKRRVYVACPGLHLHTTESADSDCQIIDDGGAPHLHCFHQNCGSIRDDFTSRLARRLSSSSIPLQTHRKTVSCPVPQLAAPACAEDAFEQFSRQVKSLFKDGETFAVAVLNPKPYDPEFYILGECDLRQIFDALIARQAKAGLGVYVATNPFKPGAESATDSKVSEHRHVLMEFDDGSLETQWDAVCNSGLPIASLVWSGGKSLHALIKVDAVDKAEHDKRFGICASKLKDLGVVADPKNKNPARWTRAAGFYRGNEFQSGFSVPERAVLSWDELSKREISIAEAFRMSAILAPAIKSLRLPHRRRLVGGWFCEADLCFVHATRGGGKTWFGLAMARALAGESEFGPWTVHQNGPVLYVDGEMPIEDIDSRIMALGGSSENLVILNHEALFHKTGKVLNLTDPAAQAGITELVLERRVQAVFLDNLSCLFSGVRENDNDDWELILPWLLTLRRHRIAVVIVAHSGRDGRNMRGASRREDAAFSVIRLDALQDTGEPRSGAGFTLRFTKDRNSPMEQPVRHWAFREQPDGKVSLEIQQADADEVLLQWVRDGLTSATEIAEELGLSKGQVSKRASKLIAEGRLVKSGRGRGYALP